MKPQETKFTCDLISLVADAVATGTIEEAQDYLIDKYQGTDNPIVEHTFNVLTTINKKLVGASN